MIVARLSASSRQRRPLPASAPQKVMDRLLLGGSLEDYDQAALRVHGSRHMVDSTVLACDVAALRADEQRALAFCVHEVLQVIQLDFWKTSVLCFFKSLITSVLDFLVCQCVPKRKDGQRRGGECYTVTSTSTSHTSWPKRSFKSDGDTRCESPRRCSEPGA